MNKIQKKIQIFLEKEQIDFDKITFLAGDASTRKYFLVLRNNKKKVLMCDFYNPSSITKFKKINRLFASAGIRVPIIFNAFPENGIMILEYFGQKKYSNIISEKNRFELYTLAIDSLIKLHKRPVFTDLEKYSKEMFIEESNIFVEWYLKLKKKKITSNFQEFSDILSELLDIPMALKNVNIHRDYHVDNLFLLSKNNKTDCGWIDHQDAVQGTCVYDLMSLLEDARLNADYTMNEKLIDYYLKHFTEIDKPLFIKGFNIVAIQRHLKVLGIFSRLYLRDKKSEYLRHIPRVINMLEKKLKEGKFKDLRKVIFNLLH